MPFNSLHYLLFFPAVIAAFFLLPHKLRWGLLLCASYYFYMSWEPKYAVLIISATLLNYFCALQIPKHTKPWVRKSYLILSLSGSLGLLFAFKYFNFFSGSLHKFVLATGIAFPLPQLHVLLPIGISFYIFQTLGYTIDVYLGKQSPEKHIGRFSLYVSFFPQLVAGPIERANNLLPQFKQKLIFDYQRVKLGGLLILWGFFKKVVIADRLAAFVDPIYNNPQASDGFSCLVATYCFAFQIFCDFSGYSDIAIGSALVIGIKLMQNFKRPYFAASVGEFWSRWHISLSTWFRDYLYIPLGGNRVPFWRNKLNLLVVFTVSGLWHGANWTFVLWGGVHGLYLVSSKIFKMGKVSIFASTDMKKNSKLRKALSILITFHLILAGWVLFRAATIQDAWVIYRKILTMDFSDLLPVLLNNLNAIKTALFALCIMEIAHIFQEWKGVSAQSILQAHWIIRWCVYIGLTLFILLFGQFSTQSQFIYFQF